MRFAAFLCLALASLAPAGLPAQAPQTAEPAANPFGRLWTPWPGTSHDALQAELEARRRAAEEASAATAAAAPAEQEQGRIQAMALGERVGEIVRMGDCEEGERIARAAGDFPLVRAVRDHCRVSGARR